jgi:predicted RNA-binding Zn ribbon-like protein
MNHEERLFPFQSGNLAVDLANTRRLHEGAVVDDFRAPADLLAWLEEAELAQAPAGAEEFRTPPVARTLLTEVRRLRQDVERLLVAHRTGEHQAPHVLYGLNRVLEASRASATLRVGPGDPRLVEVETGEGPLVVLAPIARAAAKLVIDIEPARLRRCASDRCERWFIDTSKGGRRKWCSMATCGNRAKASKHRRRVAAS